MSLLDTIVSAFTGKSSEGETNPLQAALSSLLTGNGGLQGLMTRFSNSGLGEIFSSWTGLGENKPVTVDQIHSALGPDQIQALAGKMGVDPAKASGFLAEYLPKIIDKLTPSGQVDAEADTSQGLAALLPSLLQSMNGESQQA